MSRPAWALAAFLTCTLPAAAQVPPDKVLATMKPGDGLQVELFASEPMLVNPTAIDVDAKGRVWVAEAVNYRRKNFKRPILRDAGDRIVILTDTDGDGKADKSDVFFQGPELYGPLSVLVLPLPGAKSPGAVRVLVAQSPDILEFTDADGDGKADGPPSKFLTNFGGFDHDHGVHGLTTGPDGKLYFTVGDEGVKGLQSKDGKGKKYVTSRDPKSDCQAGTVWRCDLDGNNLELIAHNFRNNYEACVDSFGEIWLSDNDDDGNQQTRICHVMPGGNYGYWPRGAGQSHWHEEQPGVVHKTLRTGFGSPTGIAVYEGSLLPGLTGQLLHCDAGPREVRAFKRNPKGAGYELTKMTLLTSSDTWFRPSDVCVGPDGSAFVADWYDPGVGGHGMGDWTRGRIYRLTPKGHAAYKVPAVKLDTKDGVLAALGSPNTATRAQAHAQLPHMTRERFWNLVDPAWDAAKDNVFRARLLHSWFICGDSSGMGKAMRLNLAYYSDEARTKPAADPRLTTAALRADTSSRGYVRRAPGDHTGPATDVAWDISFWREFLLDMRRDRPEIAAEEFYRLAKKYDGKDIFFRAALNIACGTDPARRDAILADFDKQFPDWNDTVADLVWELRPKVMLPKLAGLMGDPKLTAAQKARIVDILAASDDAAAGKTMLSLVTGEQPAEVKARALDNLRLFLPTKWAAVAKSPEMKAAVATLLASDRAAAGLQLAVATQDTASRQAIADIAADPKRPRDVRLEAIRALGKMPSKASLGHLAGVSGAALKEPDPAPIRLATIAAAGELAAVRPETEASRAAVNYLESDLINPTTTPPAEQAAAVAALAGSRAGTAVLLKLKQDGQLPADLTAQAGRLLRNSPFQGERNKAMQLFPAAGKLDPKTLPSSNALATRTGDAANGRRLMLASAAGELQCLKCHMVNGQGGQIGPDLSLIGKKGSKENLFDSLIHPSKAVADQYASWTVDTDDGQTLTGLIVTETESTFTLRDANGKDTQLPLKGTARKKSLVSLMPEGLIAVLTEDELVDLVAYLATLQTASLTPDSWTVLGPFPAADDAALDTFVPDPKAVKTGVVRAGANGYVDLAAFHGDKAPRSLSVLEKTIESPADQEVTLLVGTDDGCRLSVNGALVLKHDRHDAATPGRDRVTVKLRKGDNAVRLVIGNGSNPHGFYFTVEGGADLKAK